MFANTAEFSREAEHFKKYGFYTEHPYGSIKWQEYWSEQLRRCKEGYSVAGTRITGPHYGYLNFAQIKITQTDNRKEAVTKQRVQEGKKRFTFPDFWDGDYEYFHALEQAAAEGKHMIVSKARRKGYSYKNGWVVANKYNTERDSICLIGAFEKKYLYPEGTMAMASNYLNFLNEHTGWTKRRQLIDKIDHKKASYVEYQQGIPIEKGYKSQIIAVSFKDNPDAARGKDATLILFEEAGKFPNLKSSYLATKPTVEDGIYTTGQILIFGTGGDMEGGTIDFEDMFYDPETYNLKAFKNIWDDNAQNKICGFFVPDYKNMPGFIDKNGNSLEEQARQFAEAKRDEIKRTAKDRKAIDKHITEYPFTPKEAFLQIKGNIFPTSELLRRLSLVEGSPTFASGARHGELVLTPSGQIEFKDNTALKPILNYPLKGDEDTQGCITIFEMPVLDQTSNSVPFGVYISGIDPYDHDKSGTGSLGSCFIMNRLTNRIVAEYTARPNTAKEYYENCKKLLHFYNARALYENEKKGIFDYFDNHGGAHLLADQPKLIKDIVNRTEVTRNKGIHMSTPIKEYGESLILQWLVEPNEETNNLNKIRSIPLLKELIAYNDDINADRVMALMCLLYYSQELVKYKPEYQSSWKKPTARGSFATRFNTKTPMYAQ